MNKAVSLFIKCAEHTVSVICSHTAFFFSAKMYSTTSSFRYDSIILIFLSVFIGMLQRIWARWTEIE